MVRSAINLRIDAMSYQLGDQPQKNPVASRLMVEFIPKSTLTVFTLISFFAASSAHSQSETLIPRSMSGDKGRYYLLESKRTGDVVRAVSKRVGVDSIVFTRTETNCKTGRMRELGLSYDAVQNIKGSATGWFELVSGSSKSDLAHFICKW